MFKFYLVSNLKMLEKLENLKQKIGKQTNRLFWMTIAIGFGMSLLVYILIYRAEEKQLRAEFVNAANNIMNAIDKNLAVVMDELESVALIFQIFPEVSRQEFAAFVKPVFEKKKGILALQWIPAVTEPQRQAYEEKARKEWLPNYHFYELDKQKKKIPANVREVHFPVYYLEPLEGNLPVAGFDMASSPVRVETINEANKTHLAVVTSRIVLLQEKQTTENIYGVLLLYPIYQKSASGVRGELKGLTIEVMRIRDLIDAALKQLSPLPIDIYLFDNSAPTDSSFLYSFISESSIRGKKYLSFDDFSANPYTYIKKLSFGGRNWTFVFQAAPAFKIHTWQGMLFFTLGLILTFFAAEIVNFLIEKEKLENLRGILEEKVNQRTNELQSTLKELQTTQQQLVVQEKLASLGALAAGIAHEIKNPLNFINNFSTLGLRALQLLKKIFEKYQVDFDEADQKVASKNLVNLHNNLFSINEQGMRTDKIVKRMLQHSIRHTNKATKTDIHVLILESLRLALFAENTKNPQFTLNIGKDFDFSIGDINIVSADIDNVFLNLFNNAFYAVNSKKELLGESYQPQLSIRTRRVEGNKLEIRVRDNGTGIPPSVKTKLFIPFHTTKPPGEGTGLGLSLCHDIIVQEHKGTITCESEEGEFTEFILTLPLNFRQ